MGLQTDGKQQKPTNKKPNSLDKGKQSQIVLNQQSLKNSKSQNTVTVKAGSKPTTYKANSASKNKTITQTSKTQKGLVRVEYGNSEESEFSVADNIEKIGDKETISVSSNIPDAETVSVDGQIPAYGVGIGEGPEVTKVDAGKEELKLASMPKSSPDRVAFSVGIMKGLAQNYILKKYGEPTLKQTFSLSGEIPNIPVK